VILDEEITAEKGDIIEINYDWDKEEWNLYINSVTINVRDPNETSEP
jgi:hypothetical protein